MLGIRKNMTAAVPQAPLARAGACLVLMTTFILSGCAVGPDFKTPAPPEIKTYTTRPVDTTPAIAGIAGGNAQHFSNGADVVADWWRLFHSAPLDALITEAIRNNPDLKGAQAALRVAKENVLAQRGAYFPGITAGMSAARQSEPLTLAPIPNYPAVPQQYLFNLFTPQVTVSYAPDVFGLNRRTVESLQAQQNVARYEMAATYNTLVANVVVTAIQLASVNAQIAATHALVQNGTAMMNILQYQYDKGYANGADLAAEKAQLAAVQAALPPLKKQQAQLQNLMAVLVGRYPGQMTPAHFSFADMTLPQDIPVSLPAALVAQRPDILQAQANLHAAGARVGIAIAGRLPAITLTAVAGSMALELEKLFTTGTGFWTIGADLAAPIFQGGALLHQERGARAAYQQAQQQYRGTVLVACADVANSLIALEEDASALRAAAHAYQAALAARDIAEARLKDGYGDTLQQLAAGQAYQQAHVGLLQAQASRFADTAALFQALGGGWWHHPDLTGAQDDNGPDNNGKETGDGGKG